MRIGQFWRLLTFIQFLIMRFYCQKDSRHITRNLWKEQDEEKKQLAYFGQRILGSVLISKPHTKSNSALDYMNIV